MPDAEVTTDERRVILLLLAAQAAPVAPAKAAPETWSILVPVANEPCMPPRKDKTDPPRKDDIVVCGHPLPSQKVPYADQIPPDHPVPSNPYMTGTGVLALDSAQCVGSQGGCQVGMDLFGAGTALVRLAQKVVAPNSCCEEPGEATNPMLLVKDVVHGAGHVFARKPDKSNRVAIPLDDAPQTGTILP